MGRGVLSLCKFAVYPFVCGCISRTSDISTKSIPVFYTESTCSAFTHAVIMAIRTAAKACKENLLLQRDVLLFLNYSGV